MRSDQLGGLGISDTPPVPVNGDRICRLPPFLRHPKEADSIAHRQACLAWHLMTTKTADGLTQYLSKQKPRTRNSLQRSLIRCKAWVWLCRCTALQIRQALKRLPANEAEPLRHALNELRGANHD